MNNNPLVFNKNSTTVYLFIDIKLKKETRVFKLNASILQKKKFRAVKMSLEKKRSKINKNKSREIKSS